MNTWMAARKPWTLFLITWCTLLGAASLGVGAAYVSLGARHGLLATLAWSVGWSLLMATTITVRQVAKSRR